MCSTSTPNPPTSKARNRFDGVVRVRMAGQVAPLHRPSSRSWSFYGPDVPCEFLSTRERARATYRRANFFGLRPYRRSPSRSARLRRRRRRRAIRASRALRARLPRLPLNGARPAGEQAGEHDQVVLLAEQFGELVGAAGERPLAEDLGGVAQVLDAFTPLVRGVRAAAALPARDAALALAPVAVDPPQVALDEGDAGAFRQAPIAAPARAGR